MNQLDQDAAAVRRERLKIALIPALVLVLALVVFWPDSAPEENAVTVPQIATPVSVQPAGQATAPAPPAAHDQSWPTIDLQSTIAANPFAKSMSIKKMLGELPTEKPAAPAAPLPVEEREKPVEEDAVAPSERPAPAEEEETEPLVIDVRTVATLQAIVETPRGRTALIDSRIFRIGDRLLDEYRIVDISPEAVSVEWIGPQKNDESR